DLMCRLGVEKAAFGREAFLDSLDAEQCRLLAIEIIEEAFVKGQATVADLHYLFCSLAGRDLEGAMELIEDLEPWLHKVEQFRDALYAVVFAVKLHPDSAFDFVVRKIGEAKEGLRTDDQELDDSMKGSLLSCIAAGPGGIQKALSLFERAGFHTQSCRRFSASLVAQQANTANKRDDLLAGMRRQIPCFTDSEVAEDFRRGIFRGLGANLGGMFDEADKVRGGNDDRWTFDAAVAWVAAAGLSEEEMGLLLRGLGVPRNVGEIGKWVNWMIEQMPMAEAASKIRHFTEWWSRNDSKAAHGWLLQAGGTAFHQDAACGVAEGSAFHSLELGTEIAMLLPEGPMREQLLSSLRERFAFGEQARARHREDGADGVTDRFWQPP
ncbi:MAG: hypothetical protein JWO82_1771, partial [Akkermansiaceae bacterium]|nr:hypothetical protein [Akkermansiaceae bacterium]